MIPCSKAKPYSGVPISFVIALVTTFSIPSVGNTQATSAHPTLKETLEWLDGATEVESGDGSGHHTFESNGCSVVITEYRSQASPGFWIRESFSLRDIDPANNPFTASYKSHYDPSVNVCYLRIDRSFHDDASMITTDIADAFEGHVLASYYLQLNPSEHRATRCVIALPGKAVIPCSSGSEFNKLVGEYFGLAD